MPHLRAADAQLPVVCTSGAPLYGSGTCPEHGKFLIRIRLSDQPDGLVRVSRLTYEATSDAARLPCPGGEGRAGAPQHPPPSPPP